jgi:nitric oxide reductase large subunit
MITKKVQAKSVSSIILIGAICGAVSYIFQIYYTSIAVPFIQKVLPSVPQEVLLAIIVMLFLLILVISALLFVYWKKSKNYIDIFNFDRDPHSGVFRHKATGEYFCTSCLINQILSPTRQDDAGWYCQRRGCEQSYPNPKYRPAKIQK